MNKILLFDSNARACGELGQNDCFVIETDASRDEVLEALDEVKFNDKEDLADDLIYELVCQGFECDIICRGNVALDEDINGSIDLYD